MDLETALAFIALAALFLGGTLLIAAYLRKQQREYILPMYRTLDDQWKTSVKNAVCLADLHELHVQQRSTSEVGIQMSPRWPLVNTFSELIEVTPDFSSLPTCVNAPAILPPLEAPVSRPASPPALPSGPHHPGTSAEPAFSDDDPTEGDISDIELDLPPSFDSISSL